VVGDEGPAGRPAARLTAAAPGPAVAGTAGPATELRAAYDASADLWAAGPAHLYARLAAALLAAAGVPVTGQRVLDVGAGTGVAGRAALAAGARQVVAVDVAASMLRRAAGPVRPVVGDAAALPFRDASFGLVLAAFCLSHLGSVPAGLGEARRVGGTLAASSFTPGWTHPAKAAVDGVLHAYGFQPPAWYAAFKQDTEPAASDPGQLAGQAAAAGFAVVGLHTVAVPAGLSTPAQLAAWRLGMAHCAPFVAALDPARRAGLRRAARRAVAGLPPVVVSMTVLTAS
jgi:SAM-dependent methyltransferase